MEIFEKIAAVLLCVFIAIVLLSLLGCIWFSYIVPDKNDEEE